MVRWFNNHLEGLDEVALYGLLGDAWNAQFGEPWFADANQSEANYLGSPVEIGRREFAYITPALSDDLRRPSPFGVATVVSLTIKKSGQWQMPSSIVAALAVHQGLTSSNVVFFRRRERVGVNQHDLPDRKSAG